MESIARLKAGRTPVLALGGLLALLIVGVGVGVFSENALKAQMAREAGAQTELLASAVSGALAFDDRTAAQEYVNAVQVNPNVLAAAVYDSGNQVVASFARPGASLPPAATTQDGSTLFRDGELHVVRPVEEGGQKLGTAQLTLSDTPRAQRFSRYAGLMLVLALAGLVVLVLAAAQGALRRANLALAARAEDLAEANAQLQLEMVERERAEEALRQSQKMEAIGRLTGGIAHDFNNLMMIVSSAIDLQERTEDPARRRKLAEGVRQAIERGAGLTRQLLAFSRRAPLRTAVIDLAAQIRGMQILLERSLREDITVEMDLDEGLWPVEIDVGELELALLNLAVNARDAMSQGGRLTISAHNLPAGDGHGDRICLQVHDTGTGMAPEVAAHVFEPFFTTKEVGRGTGLGLSQVYGFAVSSGGTVALDSVEGDGSTITLCLPRSEKAITVAGPARTRVTTLSEGRILLVEDDDAVADGVGHMLRDLGYTYVRAPHATAALKALDDPTPFDLVFSDMVMPGEMDGLTLASTVRSRHPDLPVLLTTGFSEAAAAAASEGFPLLPKPYGIQDLSEALAELRAGAVA